MRNQVQLLKIEHEPELFITVENSLERSGFQIFRVANYGKGTAFGVTLIRFIWKPKKRWLFINSGDPENIAFHVLGNILSEQRSQVELTALPHECPSEYIAIIYRCRFSGKQIKVYGYSRAIGIPLQEKKYKDTKSMRDKLLNF